MVRADALDAALERMTDCICESVERLGSTIASAITAAIPSRKLAATAEDEQDDARAKVIEEMDIAGAKPETIGVSLPSSPSLVPLKSLMLTR